MSSPPIVPYPAPERHGLIGNRRTAALVAADGTVDWLCIPDYDGTILFGALLDVHRGGYWRVGPRERISGSQRYDDDDLPILSTTWATPDYELTVTDALAADLILIRRVHCERGSVDCTSTFAPRADFASADALRHRPQIWSSHPAIADGNGSARLAAGTTLWLVLAADDARVTDAAAALRLLDGMREQWRRLSPPRAHQPRAVARSAMVLQLLQYEPSGAMVAAPTTSIPERIGGGWNVDYRLAWVRDTSLAMAALVRLGDTRPAVRFLEWLTTLSATRGRPLQTLYDVRGDKRPVRHQRFDVEGYRISRPVRTGNHAFRQRQFDIFGYLTDLVLMVLDHGGTCSPEVWTLITRTSDYVATHWRLADRGIWELAVNRHYTSSRVMCWVALDRAIAIAQRLGRRCGEAWCRAAADIRAEVLGRGWNTQRRAFTQCIDGDALDASVLLIPLYGLLPASDERVRATVDRIAAELTIDGMVYRFDPRASRVRGASAMGEYEAAFVPCTLWLASVYRMLGRDCAASAITAAIDAVAGSTGLLAEGIDPRSGGFAGNFPLAFSHAERIRTALVARGANDDAEDR
jgi:GH15 family glucan-1,4-alpha-glucosidase